MATQCLKMAQSVSFSNFVIFQELKVNSLVTLFDRLLKVFKNSSKWSIFGIVKELLSTQIVNVACFARNVEWDFFGWFSNTVLMRHFVRHFNTMCKIVSYIFVRHQDLVYLGYRYQMGFSSTIWWLVKPEIRQKRSWSTVFENHRKSLNWHCEFLKH